MPQHVLYDAVSLQHLAKVSRLSILPQIHLLRTEPRWVEAVHDEVAASSHLPHCSAVLAFTWLGTPVPPLGNSELQEVFRIKSVISKIGASPADHLGESQSIVIAKRIGAVFVTDDADAFRIAENPRYLGIGYVKKVCSLLHEAQIDGLITLADIAKDHTALASAGRYMLCAQTGFSCG